MNRVIWLSPEFDPAPDAEMRLVELVREWVRGRPNSARNGNDPGVITTEAVNDESVVPCSSNLPTVALNLPRLAA